MLPIAPILGAASSLFGGGGLFGGGADKSIAQPNNQTATSGTRDQIVSNSVGVTTGEFLVTGAGGRIDLEKTTESAQKSKDYTMIAVAGAVALVGILLLRKK